MVKPVKTLLLILQTALLASLASSLAAAPSGYSINSDSATSNADSLYRVDLGAGTHKRVATVRSGGQTRIDVEGLAIAPDGTLYGMDDESMTLFALNPDTAQVEFGSEVILSGLPKPLLGGHDFGMTFACDGTLYVSALATLPDSRSLFRVGLDGKATRVGAAGSLNPVTISALAAWGNPTQLYGLGNGADENGNTETPRLYQIDTATGIATPLANPLGPAAGPYLQGGLAFDDSGQLWAITEGALFDWPSQVMKIDHATGIASNVKTLPEEGFESLAITVPRGCQTENTEVARFTVQKQYVDGNDETPVTLNIRCQTGLPLEQSFTVVPNPGPFGALEVEFTVDNFADGTLNCEVYETEPANYSPTYECFSEGDCAATEAACSFTSVSGGQENLCVIRNYPDPVEVVIATEWLFNSEEIIDSDFVNVDLYCRNLTDGDGVLSGDTMSWSWLLNSESGPVSATVYPRWNGGTECRTELSAPNSAIESSSDCADWTPVDLGDGSLTCTVTSTVFFEGIPTLSPLGLALAALLLAGTGLLAARRFV